MTLFAKLRRRTAITADHAMVMVPSTRSGKMIGPAIIDWDGPAAVVSLRRDIADGTAERSPLGETRVLRRTDDASGGVS